MRLLVGTRDSSVAIAAATHSLLRDDLLPRVFLCLKPPLDTSLGPAKRLRLLLFDHVAGFSESVCYGALGG